MPYTIPLQIRRSTPAHLLYNIETIEWDYDGSKNSVTLVLYAADADRLGIINTGTGVWTELSGKKHFTTLDTDPDGDNSVPAVICERDGETCNVHITDIDGLAYDFLTDTWWGTDWDGPDILSRFDPTATGEADGLILRDQFELPASDGGNNTCDAVEVEPVPNPAGGNLNSIDDAVFDPFTGEMYGLAKCGWRIRDHGGAYQ